MIAYFSEQINIDLEIATDEDIDSIYLDNLNFLYNFAYLQEDEEKYNKLSRQLSIRFLKDQPEIVWVCTYIYLKENEEGYFDPEWRIADPFGLGDSISLKYYISKLGNEILNKSIIGRFKSVKNNSKYIRKSISYK